MSKCNYYNYKAGDDGGPGPGLKWFILLYVPLSESCSCNTFWLTEASNAVCCLFAFLLAVASETATGS
jgi:hypothetical protein